MIQVAIFHLACLAIMIELVARAPLVPDDCPWAE